LKNLKFYISDCCSRPIREREPFDLEYICKSCRQFCRPVLKSEHKKNKIKERNRIKKEKKRLSPSSLKKEADAVFSKWIRNRGSKDGMNVCITCGAVKPTSVLQNGHFVNRGEMGTRYDEINCQVQCYACNVPNKGLKEVFSMKLIQIYGCGIIEQLNQQGKSLTQLKTQDYLDIIEKYSLRKP
jgi:hypothetical protein